jgi:hypothetical protein
MWAFTGLRNCLVKSLDACVPFYGGRGEKWGDLAGDKCHGILQKKKISGLVWVSPVF